MTRAKSAMTTTAASLRPTLMGSHHAVATGHYLATLAAMRVLDAGGNAVDAGVTAAMALAVVQPDIVSFAGVAPTLVYLEKEGRVVSLAGLGYWPAATATWACAPRTTTSTAGRSRARWRLTTPSTAAS